MTKIKDILPQGWKLASMNDRSLVEIIMGQSPPGDTYNKDKNGLPFFQGKADFGDIYPTPTVWCASPKKIALPNDILLSVRAPVGPTNIAFEKCCIGRGLTAIRCKELLNYKYLFFIMKYLDGENALLPTGSTFDSIDIDKIKKLEFPLPPKYDDQIAIANKLEIKFGELQRIKNGLNQQLDALENLPHAILRDTFRFT